MECMDPRVSHPATAVTTKPARGPKVAPTTAAACSPIIQTGGVWMQFYRTPSGAVPPGRFEPIAVFNSCTARRFICSITSIGDERYQVRVERMSS